MMQPLQEWVCDTCQQIIQNSNEGYVEWLEGISSPARNFYIIHANYYSPIRKANPNMRRSCSQHETERERRDLSLHDFLDVPGLVRLTSFIDLGPYHEPTYSGVRFNNGREFAELLRRLQLPYYEEARLYWDIAQANGYFDAANEDWIYKPDNLKYLIETYGK